MTTLTISIIVVFVLGYALIATESLTKVNKAAIAPVDVGRLLDPLHGGSNAVSPVDAP